MKKNLTKFLLALLVVGGGFHSCKKVDVDNKYDNFREQSNYLFIENKQAFFEILDSVSLMSEIQFKEFERRNKYVSLESSLRLVSEKILEAKSDLEIKEIINKNDDFIAVNDYNEIIAEKSYGGIVDRLINKNGVVIIGKKEYKVEKDYSQIELINDDEPLISSLIINSDNVYSKKMIYPLFENQGKTGVEVNYGCTGSYYDFTGHDTGTIRKDKPSDDDKRLVGHFRISFVARVYADEHATSTFYTRKNFVFWTESKSMYRAGWLVKYWVDRATKCTVSGRYQLRAETQYKNVNGGCFGDDDTEYLPIESFYKSSTGGHAKIAKGIGRSVPWNRTSRGFYEWLSLEAYEVNFTAWNGEISVRKEWKY